MTQYVLRLVEIVDDFLEGRCDFATFAERYQQYFIEVVPGSYLSDCELLVLGEVHERSEWTAPAPPDEDRVDGWIDVGEFTAWLAAFRESLPRLLPGRSVPRRRIG